MRDKLFEVVEKGDFDSMLQMLCTINFSDSDISDAFLRAAYSGRLKIVRYLIECEKTDVHYRNDTALVDAVSNGHLDIVRYLIEEAGAHVGAQNHLPLRKAAQKGHLHIVKYLASNPNIDLHFENDRLVLLAAASGNFRMLRYLAINGLSLKAHSENAILQAATSGNLEMLKYLKSRGLNIRQNNDRAIVESARQGHLHIVDYLVKQGLSVRAHNDAGLIHALNPGSMNYQIVSYFLRNGCDATRLSDRESHNFSLYKKIEDKWLPKAHPLVHEFPLYQLDKMIAIKERLVLKHGVMEMIYCTNEMPTELVFLLATTMLGKEFNPRTFYHVPLPTPLNLDIKARVTEYKLTHQYAQQVCIWLALLECNQQPDIPLS